METNFVNVKDEGLFSTAESEDENDCDKEMLCSDEESCEEWEEKPNVDELINCFDDSEEEWEEKPNVEEVIHSYEFVWKSDEDFDPEIHEFDSSNSGIKLKPEDNAKVIAYFKNYVGNELIAFIVDEINQQHKITEAKMIAEQKKMPHRMSKWHDTDEHEVYTFLGVCLLMARNSRNSLEEHWSTDNLLHTEVFSNIMSRNRFNILLKMLNVSNNDEQVPNDRLFKIRKMVEMVRVKFSANFYPYANICIEKTQFNPKSYILSDSKTGTVIDFYLYTGTNSDYKSYQAGETGNIIMNMMEPYLDKGHSLFIDTTFTSPVLFKKLHERKTNACGIVDKNQVGLPSFEETVGDCDVHHTDIMMTQLWKERTETIMLSTMHTPNFIETKKRNSKTNESLMKPCSVVEHTVNAVSIDRSEGISFVKAIAKSSKWFTKVFFQLIDLCLYNSYIAFTQNTGKTNKFAQFQLELVRQLIDQTRKYKNKRKRVNSDMPSRLDGANSHFPIMIKEVFKSARRRCVVCSAKKKRQGTKFGCEICLVALCPTKCFKIFHTVANY